MEQAEASLITWRQLAREQYALAVAIGLWALVGPPKLTYPTFSIWRMQR